MRHTTDVKLLFIVLFAQILNSEASTSLVLNISHAIACPRYKVVLTCIISGTGNNIVGRWRAVGTMSQVFFAYDEALQTNSLLYFNITKNDVPPGTVISTATLQEATFAHNDVTMECFFLLAMATQTKTIRVAGSQSSPTEININSPAILTWLPPASDMNCSFTYTVNITNSSSVTEQMYSNNTSLILTDLTRGESYSFAVAVTDSTGQHGQWSEELRVTWDVPRSVMNFNVVNVNIFACIISWKAPSSISEPAVLYYTISHNVTESESVETLNTTALNITLGGASLGHTYLITVYAVNGVGAGISTSGTCTVVLMKAVPSSVPTSTAITTKLTMATTVTTACTTPPSLIPEQNPAVYTNVAVATVVSGVLSAVGTAVVTSIITWCVVVRCRQQAKPTATSSFDGEKAFSSTELTPVEYEVPVLKDQSITVGDNVAYGNKITLQQNVAYEQVYT